MVMLRPVLDSVVLKHYWLQLNVLPGFGTDTRPFSYARQ